MNRRFFRLSIDAEVPGRWYFSEPTTLEGEEIDNVWQFSEGRPVDPPGRLRILIYRPGAPLDFTTAGVGLTPIVSARVASVLLDMAGSDVQLFPVEVEDQHASYQILNVAQIVRCIDDKACQEVQRYRVEDGRPDQVGEYRAVSGLRIDKSKVGGARIFRLWGWHPPIILDEELKVALENTGILGARFDEV